MVKLEHGHFDTNNVNINLLLIFLFLINFVPESFGQQPDSVAIKIQTNLGDIHVFLYPKKAPLTCSNFLKYIDQNGINGGSFYRTVTPENQPDNFVKIGVIQGGFNPDDPNNPDNPDNPGILLERTNLTGILHKDGTLSMARDDPDSGNTEFFICIGDQPSLDFGGARNPDGQGFAAFGRVSQGMDIVRKIQLSPAVGQTLTPPVKILNFQIE